MPTVLNTYPGKPDNGEALDGDIVAARIDAIFAVINDLDDDNFNPASGKELNLSTKTRLANNTYLKAKLAAGTAVDLLGINASDEAIFGNASYAAKVLGSTLNVTPNATFAGTLGVAGTTTISGALTVSGTHAQLPTIKQTRGGRTADVWVSDSGEWRVDEAGVASRFVIDLATGATSVKGNLNVDSGTLYVDAANNVTGFGTVSPATGVVAHMAGNIRWDGTTSTSASAGGATALPATPVGYIQVNIAGTNRKIPYYA